MRNDLPRILTAPVARRLGVSRSAVRHAVAIGRWQPLCRGVVLTAAGEPTRWDWALAGLAVAGPAAALTGWDVLRWSGLTRRLPAPGPVLVLSRAGGNRSIGGVRIRPTSRRYTTRTVAVEDEFLPLARLVGVARALSDTPTSAHAMRGIAASAIQRRLCTPEELAAERRAMPRPWRAVLNQAVADAFAGVRSIVEGEAVDALRGVGVSGFVVNRPIVVDRKIVAVPDLWWPDLGYIIEIDGREYHFEYQEWQATLQRHSRLTRLGLAVEHFPPSVIRADPVRWALGVRDEVRRRERLRPREGVGEGLWSA